MGSVHPLRSTDSKLDQLGRDAARLIDEIVDNTCGLEKKKAALQAAIVEAHELLRDERGAFGRWLTTHRIPRSTAYLYVQEEKEPAVRERRNTAQRSIDKKRRSSKARPALDTSPSEPRKPKRAAGSLINVGGTNTSADRMLRGLVRELSGYCVPIEMLFDQEFDEEPEAMREHITSLVEVNNLLGKLIHQLRK